MKKKLIYIIPITLALIIGLGILIYKTNYEVDTFTMNAYKNNRSNVDAGLEELMATKEYRTANLETQIEFVGDILKLYELHGELKNLYYDEGEGMYSYEYEDGILGGVKVKPFPLHSDIIYPLND